MFSSDGYIDLRSIVISLIQEIEAQGGLYFPSIEHVSIEQLAWLAWRYGEWDFLEEAVFERALEVGLFVCSSEGRIMQVSMNPLSVTAASAIDLFKGDEGAFVFKEKLVTNVPANKNFEHKAGQDPWAKHRGGGYRSVPMVFSRSNYIVSLENYEEYCRRLVDVGYRRLAESPFPSGAGAEAWRNFEGWSLCIAERSIPDLSIEPIKKKAQFRVFSSIWENAEEMFSQVLEPETATLGVSGKVNVETKAIAAGEAILNDPNYKFRTLEQLRSDISVELGERAWRRVVDALRPRFPDISKPGRKS